MAQAEISVRCQVLIAIDQRLLLSIRLYTEAIQPSRSSAVYQNGKHRIFRSILNQIFANGSPLGAVVHACCSSYNPPLIETDRLAEMLSSGWLKLPESSSLTNSMARPESCSKI